MDLWRLILSKVSTLDDLKNVFCVKFFKQAHEHQSFWTDLHLRYFLAETVPSEPWHVLREIFQKRLNSVGRCFKKIDLESVAFGEVTSCSPISLSCPVLYHGDGLRCVTSEAVLCLLRKHRLDFRFSCDSEFFKFFLHPLIWIKAVGSGWKKFELSNKVSVRTGYVEPLGSESILLRMPIPLNKDFIILGPDGDRLSLDDDRIPNSIVRAQICLHSLRYTSGHKTFNCCWILEKLFVIKFAS